MEVHFRSLVEDVVRVLDTNTTEFTDSNDSEALRNTLLVYGSLFAILFFLFCCLRKCSPRTYTVRNWVEPHKTVLAEDQYGFLSWTWSVFLVRDGQLLEEIGLDNLCLARIYDFGWRLCFFGMLNGAWLMPLYYLAEDSDDTDYIKDPIVSLTISHVPSGSIRLIGATIASYLNFGYACYLLMGEIRWFTKYRHDFLTKRSARNYSVYVQCIPKQYQSNGRLLNHFRELFPAKSVVESNVGLQITRLSKRVLERNTVLGNLEHAINVKRVKGTDPTHSTSMCGAKVSSIPTYTAELQALNKKVKASIERLELLDDGIHPTKDDAELGNEQEQPREADELLLEKEKATKAIKAGRADGAHRNAAFVSFNSLRSRTAALQMEQYDAPFEMEVFEAPDPEDVFWGNLGNTHGQLQLGRLFSFLATAALCLFWTVVIAAATSLSTVEGLKSVDFIADLIDAFPFLEPVFKQLAPLIIVVVNILLTVFLRLFSSFEGPISGSTIDASLFTKLAWFMIIQNFFVVALAGGLLSAYSNIVEDPLSAVDLLANSLPAQSTLFIQIVVVNVLLGLALELLRVVPIVIAWIRGMFGPGLTPKEKSAAWFGLRPLSDPSPFSHPSISAWTVLYFMVFFVYSVIAPLSCFFLGFLFLLLGMGYRHQFMYIYPKGPNSGGKIFLSFLNFVCLILVVAEITVLALLGIKKSPIAAALMLPLLIVTIFFVAYIKQKHLSQPEYLPARRCIIADFENEEHGQLDDSFLYRAYTHPDLKTDKEALPDNMTVAGSRDEGLSTNEYFQDEDPPLDDVDSQSESPSAAPDLKADKEALPDNMTVAGSRDEGPSTNEYFQDEDPPLDDVDSQSESPSAAGVFRDEDPSTVVISNIDEHKRAVDSKSQLRNDDVNAEDQDENTGYSV